MFNFLAWAFVGAVATHNLEEAFCLPDWSRAAGRFHPRVGAIEFRFAVAVLTALAAACAIATTAGSVVGRYLVCGYALAMALNVIVPHVAATIALKRHMPGTATGLLLNLPVCSWLLFCAFDAHLIELGTFAWVAPLVVIAIVGMIPPLFWIGRRLNFARA